jgi:hypothetical protein
MPRKVRHADANSRQRGAPWISAVDKTRAGHRTDDAVHILMPKRTVFGELQELFESHGHWQFPLITTCIGSVYEPMASHVSGQIVVFSTEMTHLRVEVRRLQACTPDVVFARADRVELETRCDRCGSRAIAAISRQQQHRPWSATLPSCRASPGRVRRCR